VQKGQALGLTGFVRNTAQGTVQGEAQGVKPKLEEFVKVGAVAFGLMGSG
jgi:acylphosphatase